MCRVAIGAGVRLACAMTGCRLQLSHLGAVHTATSSTNPSASIPLVFAAGAGLSLIYAIFVADTETERILGFGAAGAGVLLFLDSFGGSW